MNSEDDCQRETRLEWLDAVRSRLDARFFEGLSEEITGSFQEENELNEPYVKIVSSSFDICFLQTTIANPRGSPMSRDGWRPNYKR